MIRARCQLFMLTGRTILAATAALATQIATGESPAPAPTRTEREAAQGIWKAAGSAAQRASSGNSPVPNQPDIVAVSAQEPAATESATPQVIDPQVPYHSTQWRPWPGTGSVATTGAPVSGVLEQQITQMEPTAWGGSSPHGREWHSRSTCSLAGEALAMRRDRWEGGPFVYKGINSVISTNHLDAGTEWGGAFAVNTSIGEYRELEFSGFLLSELTSDPTAKGAFTLSIPVSNAPAGFEDFAQNVSFIKVDYETEVGGLELICRSWNIIGDPCGCPGCGSWCSGQSLGGLPLAVALGLGVRYLNINEDFSVYSQFGPTPSLTGLQDYLYHTSTENYLVGPQLDVLATSASWNDIDFVFSFKCALAANFINTNVSLREYTPATAFNKDRDGVAFAQVLNVGAYLRWRPVRCAEFRAGYQVLWVNGYAGAPDQFSSNLARPGQFDDDNNILLQGPALMLSVLF